MPELTWSLKAFDDLTPLELYNIFHLRIEVFMLEQDCLYQEVDHKDVDVEHLMCFQEKELVAYARILAPGKSYKEPSIGRIITKKSHRGIGLGKVLIEKCIHRINDLYGNSDIRISAQEYLVDYYGQFNFEPLGEIYLEDNLPHIEMLRIDPNRLQS